MSAVAANVQDSIVLFGDSITQGSFEPGFTGFGQRLAHIYARRLDVLNRGLSGYNTEWAVPVLKECLVTGPDCSLSPKIRLITIWFGANDACIKSSPQHVSLGKFIYNLNHMVTLVRSSGSSDYSVETRIVLITPPPVNTYQRAADLASRDPPKACDRDFEVTREYAAAVKTVAEQKKVAVVDVWTALYEAAGEDERTLSKFLVDGLHLNEAGYQIVYDELMKTIQKEYPDVYYENLPFTFPP
ncbi:hypothetical protein AMATHDRAFT_74226 [Amanita thiersii Skay4041]|uniref:SGNH hydrolase-type esterase domain-containing protein n=1 Tax=Amanita thiersii Skay4041 TaxID=703135 RepID=A0A2A9NSW0_9AGAR|nr:hypothetical protein AMATHDRAFT_74226 [Amanita thiersii Skay4041]